MKSEKEILDALHTLKEVCEEANGKCHRCMLCNEVNYCGVIMNNAGDMRDKMIDLELKSLEYPRLILN